MLRTTLGVFVCSLAVVGHAAAADEVSKSVSSATATADDTDLLRPPLESAQPSRGAFLGSLYVSFAALQAYDGYTTTTAFDRGAREMNPLLGSLVEHPAAFWAVKGGSTALAIFMAERLWRDHHHAEALAVMFANNAIMAAVAARNASVLRTLR